MCGIVGYFGREIAGKEAIEMLKNLEYRGYDSWGISIKQKNGFFTLKKVGKISQAKIPKLPKAKIAILHSRWATHGNVTAINAHPHFSNNGKIVVVHNGIIENYQELKEKLKKEGFRFKTQTDTEVIPNILQKNLGTKKATKQDLLLAMAKTVRELEGNYALLIMHKDVDAIFAARKGSPLLAGIDKSGNAFFASDISAFLKHTNDTIFFNDGELAVADCSGISFSDFALKPIKKHAKKIALNISQLDKQGYPHYMIKEIMEQRETVKEAITQNDEKIMDLAKAINESFGSYLIGCGTAGRVALAGTYLFSKIARKHVNFTVASEFPNYIDFIKNKSLVIAISQSGETADTLEAIRAAKKKNAKIMAIINSPGTTMERLSDYVLPVRVGIEKSVASTKAATGQIAILALLAYASVGKLKEGKHRLFHISDAINEMLTDKLLDKTKELAKRIKKNHSIYIIGRGLNYPIALESAIKLQEIGYIHAEGFAAGELKHGPLALIEKNTPCIAFVSEDENKKDILSNAMEVKARGGFIIGIAPKNNEIFNYWIKVPDEKDLTMLINLIPIQLLAYYLGVEKGHDVDYPRNLAKCCTVK